MDYIASTSIACIIILLLYNIIWLLLINKCDATNLISERDAIEIVIQMTHTTSAVLNSLN